MSQRKHKGGYDGKIAGLYDLEETIGKGHFAVVKLARHVFTGEKVAVKVIDKTKLDEVSKAHLFQEVRCMKLVQHPNVVRLYEVIDTQTKLYLILELGDGGDMYDHIMKHDKGLNEEVARTYFRQIVQAISYCHKLHVVHRDLKPENVVFFEKLGIVKLTDFGFSNKFIPGMKLETSCGSLAYSAPEILLGDSYDAPAVDVWSLGVILFMLVSGAPPFQEANDSETLTMILDCKYRLPPDLSKQCTDLIGRMLVREPSKRAKLEEILVDKWVCQGQDDSPPMVPLISREHISEGDHNHIVQRMVEGRIAAKEEILSSIDKDAYNHITATYYLLAERKLNRMYEMQAAVQAQRQSIPFGSGSRPQLSPLALSPRVQSLGATHGDPFQRNPLDPLVSPPNTSSRTIPEPSPGKSTDDTDHSALLRRCSLIKEESVEEDDEDMDLEQEMSKSADDYLSDDGDNRPDRCSPSRAAPPIRRNMPVRPLHTVRSSPQLLNQIFEEGESEEEHILGRKASSPRRVHVRSSIGSPEGVRKFEHTRKKRLTSGQRGTSCSSSDASDTDETDNRKRKEKLKSKLHRKDSSDHSSDTDGPGGSHGGPNGSAPFGGSRGFGGGGKDRDSRDRRDKDHDDENRHSNKSRGKHGGTKHNCSNDNPVGKDSMEKKYNSSADIPVGKDGMENRHAELTPKMSNVSITSNLSNLSLSSLGSRSSKYLVESTSNTPKGSVRSKEVEAMNLENKARTRIIHVRSKDFSDLMDRFSQKGDSDDGSSISAKETVVGLKKRRSRDKMKIDINRNGLKAGVIEKEEPQPTENQPNVKTKCCSLV